MLGCLTGTWTAGLGLADAAKPSGMTGQPVCRYLAPEAAPLVRNFALVYVEMAMDRSTGEQQMEQVGYVCCLSAQWHGMTTAPVARGGEHASACTGPLQAVCHSAMPLGIAVPCNAAVSHW